MKAYRCQDCGITKEYVKTQARRPKCSRCGEKMIPWVSHSEMIHYKKTGKWK